MVDIKNISKIKRNSTRCSTTNVEDKTATAPLEVAIATVAKEAVRAAHVDRHSIVLLGEQSIKTPILVYD